MYEIFFTNIGFYFLDKISVNHDGKHVADLNVCHNNEMKKDSLHYDGVVGILRQEQHLRTNIRESNMQLLNGKFKSIESENIMEENHNRIFSF